jgi:hypothetical protein
MKGPRCQHENEAGAKFCEECAALRQSRKDGTLGQFLSLVLSIEANQIRCSRGRWEQARWSGFFRRAHSLTGTATQSLGEQNPHSSVAVDNRIRLTDGVREADGIIADDHD